MEIFLELSLALFIAAVFSLLAHKLKQPLVVAYMTTGILIGPLLLNFKNSLPTLEFFSHIGIAFLLFVVGISLRPEIIKEAGKASVVAGIIQILFTVFLGYVISRLFYFGVLESLYISLALAFSSTIIILKILSDKGDLEKIFGQISAGILIIQDIAAVAIIILVSSLAKSQSIPSITLANILIKSLVIFLLLKYFAQVIIPKISHIFARSQELMFLFAMAWGLGIASLFYIIGFSLEIGALAAGVVLSTSNYNREISAKLKPLRDFFIILFFIFLGVQFKFGDLSYFWLPVVVFSVFVILGKPLIVFLTMRRLHYTGRISLFTGLALSQVSEFSLILIMLGISLEHILPDILSLMTAISIVTITVSAFMMENPDWIYNFLKKRFGLSKDEWRDTSDLNTKKQEYEAILFGYNRIGFELLKSFKKIDAKFIVVDYNPRTVEHLKEDGINCIYGDVNDSELLQSLGLKKIKLAVSTIPEFGTSELLIKLIRKTNRKAIIMVISHDIDCALELYQAGASYVIMPHFLGGSMASLFIKKFGFIADKFKKEKIRHIKHLKKRKLLGHTHPIHNYS